MELLVQLEEYTVKLTETSGFVVVLHDQNHAPIPEEEGIMVAPGFETRLGVQRVRMQIRAHSFIHVPSSMVILLCYPCKINISPTI